MNKTSVDAATIEEFLHGRDPQKYIVAVEGNYNTPTVELVINDPETGKRTETHKCKPFLWFKQEIGEYLYLGNRQARMEAGARYGVKITSLKTSDSNGFTPERLDNGFKFLAVCDKSYNQLVNFFQEGGVDIFHKDYTKDIMMFSPAEQFLIQSGKRLFKGIEDYNDVHRLQFDLETEGLNPSIHSIFQIGIRDNRGFERIFETQGETHQQRRDSERQNLQLFFQIIDMIKPDVITGYNSENFDWDFIFKRGERLGAPIPTIAISLGSANIKRKPSKIKFGQSMEDYIQTSLYGYNIIDISHSVRRAQAINSDIQKWNLKYITQYSDIAKPNRVYIQGDLLHKLWSDTDNEYAFNDENGDWYKMTEIRPLKTNYTVVSGAFIVRRYLLDDLWETEHIDTLFNQATFLIGKLLPTTYQRSSTMGTAGQWKLLMAAWSYENNLAVPSVESKRDFTGGLSRLFRVGYAKGVDKFDYAALYPKAQLTWDIFPPLDISGVMKGLLTYIVDTRDKFKFLTEEQKQKVKDLKKKLPDTELTKEEKDTLKKEIDEASSLKNLYDKKQLPLKILANSWFGSYGAPYIFNWGDTDYAEETTCRGRQALRLMVKFFKGYGFEPLVLDTDGCNFSRPENIDEIRYTAKGSHWKTTNYAGKELTGVQAALAEFNETLMEGKMGLDLDDSYESTINFARKNYANNLNGKVKLVGNSIKSKKMPTYIEEFVQKSIKLLLNNQGREFIDYYYEHVDKIYNFQIPMVNIASKSKVTISMAEYRKKAKMKNKAGNPMPKQAHMELALRHNLEVTQGDVIYYVNTGKVKSHGDLKSIKDEQGNVTVQLNCKMLDTITVEADSEAIKERSMLKKTLEQNPDHEDKVEMETRIHEINTSLLTDEYNVQRYLAAFNKKVEPLLIVFNEDIRNNILIKIVKDKKTKLEKLQDRSVFTEEQCELCSGIPMKAGQQDDIVLDLYTMEDKEIKFWDKVNKLPNYMQPDEWESIRADYHERLRIMKVNGVRQEKENLIEHFKRLELADLNAIRKEGKLHINIFIIADVNEEGELVSRKWGETLFHLRDIFRYEDDAKARADYYLQHNIKGDDKYDTWLTYKAEILFITGTTEQMVDTTLDTVSLTDLISLNKVSIELPPTVAAKTKASDDEDEDDEEEAVVVVDVEEDDFQPALEYNAYIENVGPVHVETRPNIPIYPPHKPLVFNVPKEPEQEVVTVEDEDDEWNF